MPTNFDFQEETAAPAATFDFQEEEAPSPALPAARPAAPAMAIGPMGFIPTLGMISGTQPETLKAPPQAPAFEEPLTITERGPLYRSQIEEARFGALRPPQPTRISELTGVPPELLGQARVSPVGRALFGGTEAERAAGIPEAAHPELVQTIMPALGVIGGGVTAGSAGLKAAETLLYGGWAEEFIRQSPEAFKAFADAMSRDDWSEARKIATEWGIGAVFTALTGAGLHRQLLGETIAQARRRGIYPGEVVSTTEPVPPTAGELITPEVMPPEAPAAGAVTPPRGPEPPGFPPSDVLAPPTPQAPPRLPPVVPVTPPTLQLGYGMTVLQEIRDAGARTTAQVQALFPARELSREEAADLRRQAWGEEPPAPPVLPPPAPTPPPAPPAAPAVPTAAAASPPKSIVPALLVNGKPVTGLGEHKDIFQSAVDKTEDPDQLPALFQAQGNDDQHVFVLTREDGTTEILDRQAASPYFKELTGKDVEDPTKGLQSHELIREGLHSAVEEKPAAPVPAPIPVEPPVPKGSGWTHPEGFTAVVSRTTKPTGKPWVVTYFDKDLNAVGHRSWDTMEEAEANVGNVLEDMPVPRDGWVRKEAAPTTRPKAGEPLIDFQPEPMTLEAERQFIKRRLDELEAMPQEEWEKNAIANSDERDRLQKRLPIIERRLMDEAQGIGRPRPAVTPTPITTPPAAPTAPAQAPPTGTTAEGLQAGVEAAAEPSTDHNAARLAANTIVQHLRTGIEVTKADVQAIMEGPFGGTMAQGAYSSKDMTDVIEMAVNLYILREFNPEILKRDIPAAMENVAAIKKLMDRLPTQTTRTIETDKMQQFSTPPTHSYVMAWVANVAPTDVVLEPSAGIGGVAVFPKLAGAKVIANELSPRRLMLLRQLGIANYLTQHNAEHIDAYLTPDILSGRIPRPTLVEMNPPFSQSATADLKRTSVGAQHVEKALELLPPGGRLVAIVGEGMGPGKAHFKAWWNRIALKYNVRANIGISGEEYRKYGTSFDNQIIVIDKTGPTPQGGTVVGQVDKVEDLIPLLEPIRNDRPRIEPPPAQPSGAPTPAPGAGGGAPAAPIPPQPRPSRPAVPGGGAPGAGRPAPQAPGGLQPQRPAPTVSPGVPAGGPVTAGSPSQAPAPTGPGHKPLFEGGDAGLRIEQKAAGERVLSEHGIFSEYKPSKVHIAGSQPHPTPLVEPTAMAAVEPVDPTYRPHLSRELITQGHLSDSQLENVVYAGQAHQKLLPTGERMGYFIGDGTGVGKGREISAIIMDNWNQGRTKAVWVSANKNLINDAKRDLKAIGLDLSKLIDLAKNGGKNLTTQPEGVVFVPYSSLRSQNPGIQPESKPPKLVPVAEGEKPSRMHRLQNWLGSDFDGVIVFDEAHLAGNAIDIKGARGVKEASAQGMTVLDVQKLFPKARIVYSSATGATDVVNLSYGDRLGIWGHGTPFPSKLDFFNAVQAGGLSAMEIVARDLKSMGRYLARTLSFEGVTQEQLVHRLTPDQKDIYNELSRAWQLVLTHRDETMAHTGAANNGRARAAANSAFYGAQQRFYNQLLTAMQTPSVIADMKDKLAKGNSILLQIVNTNEATLNRELAEKGGEAEEGETSYLEDLDLTPKDILLQHVSDNYPTALYEPYTDDNGNTKWRPVLDAQGQPVDDPVALQRKQELLDRLALLKAPTNPLDMIIDAFGVENVAEVTGRTRRVVQKMQEDGTRKRVLETNRGDAHRKVEAEEYNDLKRRILIFSDAGGTGFSYHASKKVKNQQRRYHYLLQAGWRAAQAIQGLGRSHRSDQASAPHYIPVSTDISGHKRFISSICRRLSELGALTGGERKAAAREMFDESNDLENDYAEATILQYFRDLHGGRVEGSDFNDICRKLGYVRPVLDPNTGQTTFVNTLIDSKTGGLNVAKIPSIQQFLNRILVLEVEQQDKVFNDFFERLQQRIENAKNDGSYDPGTQTLKALAIRKISDQVVYSSPESTAKTRLVEIEHDQQIKRILWESRNQVDPRRPIVEHVRNIRSGKVFALKEGPSRTLESGQVVDTWRRISPTGYDIIPRRNVQTERMYGEEPNYQVLDEVQAKKLWDDQFAKAPKIKTIRDTYVVGAFLPIWDRLKIPSPRIWRIKTDEGENLLGALVPQNAVEALRDRMGATTGEAYSPKAIFTKVLDNGETVSLANDWKIKRSRVAGEQRIEVIGPESRDINEFEKFIGGYIERIQWTPRFFLPTEEEAAVAALEKLIRKSPVVKPKGPTTSPGTTGGELYSGIPLPGIIRAFEYTFRDLWEKIPTVSSSIRTAWRSFTMQTLPRITGASRESGEAGARYASAPMVARAKGIQFAAEVTEGITDPTFDKKFGTGLTEDNLRDVKQKWLDRANEAENRDQLIADLRDEIEDLRDAARAGDEVAKESIRSMRREISRLSELTDEDVEAFRESARNVTTMIGAQNSPFPTEADYRAFMQQPETQRALAKHIALWNEEKEPLYREAADIDPDVQLETRGKDYGARINLKNVLRDQGTPTTVGPNASSPLIRATATLRRRDPFAIAAKGAGSYEGSYQEIMANGFEREYPVAKQHEFIRKLVASGNAKITNKEFEPELEIKGESTKGYPLRIRPWANKFIQIRKSMAAEYEDVAGLSAQQRLAIYTKVANIMTRMSIQGLAEGSTHISNLLMQVFTGIGPTSNPMLNTMLKTMSRADLAVSLPKVLINAFADRKEDMLRLAEIGAAKQPYRGGVGWFITKIDHGVRLYAADVYSKMAEKGWVPDTETGLREFVNQVGQYNKRLQPRWIQIIRSTGIQPFATAMQTFNVQGVRTMVGSPGIKAANNVAALALRADKIAGILGFVILVAVLNMLVSQNASGPPGTKLGAVGWIGDDGRLHQLDLGSLTGMSRGPRITGLQGYVEARRLGLTQGTAIAAGAQGAANTLISAATGPMNRELFMAITGKRPSIPPIQEAPVVPPQEDEQLNLLKTQTVRNILESAKQANPIVDASIRMMQGKYEEALTRQVSRYTPRTGMKEETIENLPKIVQASELRAYTEALAKEARKLPLGADRTAFIMDRLDADNLSGPLRRRAMIELRRHGAFTH